MGQPSFILYKATDVDAVGLAPFLREADRDEVYAAAGMTPLAALRHSIGVSPKCTSACDDDGVFAIWGVGVEPLEPRVGIPWMLGADRLVRKYRRALLRETQQQIERMRHEFARLENWVDARNVASIRWLRWCGFTIHPAEPYGFLKLPFHRFERAGENN